MLVEVKAKKQVANVSFVKEFQFSIMILHVHKNLQFLHVLALGSVSFQLLLVPSPCHGTLRAVQIPQTPTCPEMLHPLSTANQACLHFLQWLF